MSQCEVLNRDTSNVHHVTFAKVTEIAQLPQCSVVLPGTRRKNVAECISVDWLDHNFRWINQSINQFTIFLSCHR